MRMSIGVRIGLGVLAVVLGVAALIVYSVEDEYGGQEAVEGLAKGYLPSAVVEVRDVSWADSGDAAIDYEVIVEDSDATVQLIDGGGEVLFTGTPTETNLWLDAQGSQMYTGSNAGADGYLNSLRDGAKSFAIAWVLGIVAAVALIAAVIPNRHPRSSSVPTPTTM